MKVSSKTIQSDSLELELANSYNGDLMLWIDLYGNSYSPMARTSKQAVRCAKELRQMADWIETWAVPALTKPKKTVTKSRR